MWGDEKLIEDEKLEFSLNQDLVEFEKAIINFE